MRNEQDIGEKIKNGSLQNNKEREEERQRQTKTPPCVCFPLSLSPFSFIANKLSGAGGIGRLMASLSLLYTPK